ncbi:MAG: NADH-quinone oxidoreductase subunit J [Deltaproteobacteria bacterium]|nr:NADH-quinone oxidoreductase subunit J [Deltaproteobacteria bacterium]
MTTGLKIVLLLAELLCVSSAILVTFHPNILHAAVALLFAFLGVAVMFVYAGADFIAGVQVIVYVGGVTVLVLFAVMLTHWLYKVTLRDVRKKLIVPIVLLVILLVPAVYKSLVELASSSQNIAPERVAEFAGSAKTALIGQALLGNYLLPFEAITILLLGALVGAVGLARPK